MPITAAALLTELQTNPTGLADSAGITLTQHATAGRYQNCADLLNKVGTATIATGPLPPPAFAGQLLLAELASASLPAFAAAWQSVMAATGGADLNDADVWTVVTGFFPSTTKTYSNLTALKTRPCSRAETLAATPGYTVAWQDVAAAMRSA